MDIGIIGASAAGIYAALHLSRTKEDVNIHLFDRADKIGKKLLATGNGHCNLMHVPFVPDAFNHPEFVSKLLSRFDEEFLTFDLHAHDGITFFSLLNLLFIFRKNIF